MQLVINTFVASLRKDGDRFLVKAGDKQLAVSAHKVQTILIATGAHFSTDAIQLAHEHNIDVTPADRLAAIRQIKTGAPRLVISTQWIEAGVDIDMDFVVRDFGPLDS